MKRVYKLWYIIAVIMLMVFPKTLQAQSGMNEIGSFEQTDPSYWHKAGEPGGATLTWASDEYVTLGKSLKITKETTGDAAYWESDNMCDIWSPTHSADVDIKIGALIKTDGVNTNPTTEDEMWYISYTFVGESGNLIGEVKLPIDQSVATSSGWVADTNDVGSLILSEPSYTTTIKFVGGKDAVGTVWADEFILNGRTDWAGGIWNETLGVPEGWIYWLPRDADNEISDGYKRTRITDEEAYNGKYSLKFDMLDGTHDGFIGTKMYELNEVQTGDKIRISVWIKGEDLEPDSVIAVGDQWTVSLTPIFHSSLGGNDGFNDIWASDIPLFFPTGVTSFDWTQYYIDVTVPENALSMSMRLHPLGRFQGTVFMDAMTIEKLDLPEMSEIGSFEQTDPSYWHKAGEPGGATLTWASDEYITLGKSLKITKETTGDAAYWESDNMCDIWSPTHSADVDIKIGAMIKTEGVNTNPTTEDEMWYISYSFVGESGNLIGEVKLPIDQSVATSSGWVADTNDVGSLILSEPSYTTTIKFVGGKDAVGTVWADEFILNGRTDWAGGIWNETLGVPEGWIYWLPRDADNEISDGYERTRITDEEAYHGKYSLKFDLLDGTHDGFIGTRMFPLNNPSALGKSNDISALNDVNVGDWLRISVWIMGEDLEPDSVIAVGDQWTVSLTPIFHSSLGGNDGFNDIWASDIPLFFPAVTSFGWTQYYVDVQVPENALSLSMRLHPLGRFQGTVYMDAMTIEKLDLPEMSEIGSFEQTDPSYWHKAGEPGGATLTWASDEYITLGKSLKITKETTGDAAYWESDNMCDIWSPTHSADVDIKIGAMIKTEGVNTNPTTEDEMWYISYTFMGESGNLIGEVKLPIDQSTASSSGWVADTNDVGSLILSEPSYTTTIKFVGGKDAVGTVWADEFILNGRTDWAGGIWNETLGVPEGWIYWLPRDADNEISDGYERTRITDEEAYHGKYSLKYDMLDGTHDGFIGTRMFPLNNTSASSLSKSNDITELNDVNVGDWLRISVWIKGEDLQPDSVIAVGDQWTVSLTPIFHSSLGGNDGFNDIWASDIPLFFPAVTEFDWTQFYVDVQVPENALSMSMRLHPLGRFQGTVFMDAMEIKKINDVTDIVDQYLPTDYSLFQNYPNPFNPTTVISYALPKTNIVSMVIYDMLGRQVRTLVNEVQNAGMQKVIWDGKNNSGMKVSSGTYIYRIDAGDFHMAKKMIILK